MKSQMRTSNSIKNSIAALTLNAISVIISFIAQKMFLTILNAEYLGVNGLFSNVISMISIAELGIGEIIIFHLYKPIAENNKERVKTLLGLYKKAYNTIAFIVLCLGLCFIPFLGFFIGETTLNLNFTLVYILFLLQTVISYILTYKRSILYANQKNYIINIVHIFYLVILNVVQLLILFLTKNYYIYLAIKIVLILLENIIITIISNKLYPYITDKNIKKLDKKTEKDIFARIKAQLLHKIGGVVVNSTDNIIISKFFGVITTGLYSNYFLIINAVKSLFSQILSSITASVGNLLVEADIEKTFSVYKKIRFLNFWIATFCSVSIFVVIQSFITLWIGSEYLLSIFVLGVLVLNLYQKMMRSCNDLFLAGAGICVENKYVPLVESILNIVFSIICLKIFGLAGVFMGTIISGLALWCYSYPKFVYKKLFNRSYKDYAKGTIGYILLFILIATITYYISLFFIVENALLQVVINVIICLIVPNLILFIIFRKTDEFKYFKKLVSNIFNKVFKKIKRK